MEKLIITVAPVGAEVTRENNINLPLTPEEIAHEAVLCEKAGAAIIHLHVRDKKGEPTQSKAVFKEVMTLIKARTNLIIQPSTGGANWMTAAMRMEPLELNPEMATLTTGTVNFGDEVFSNPPEAIEEFAKTIQTRGIKPEIEVFDTGMIYNALRLIDKGLLTPPLHFDFVMGVPGGISGEGRHLIHLIESLPPKATWSVAGIGRSELPLAVMAIALGGHVRVGFEDNVYYLKGRLAENNAQLVGRIARIAAEMGRDVASADEARAILGIKK